MSTDSEPSLVSQIRQDAQIWFQICAIADDPVQCGTTHANFAKWLWCRYEIQCQFWSIAEKDLPPEYPSSKGADDESFLIIPSLGNLLVDICATPESGAYVGPNVYDMSRSHLWTICFPEIHSPASSLVEFAQKVHWIDLGCPEVLKYTYPMFWRGGW